MKSLLNRTYFENFIRVLETTLEVLEVSYSAIHSPFIETKLQRIWGQTEQFIWFESFSKLFSQPLGNLICLCLKADNFFSRRGSTGLPQNFLIFEIDQDQEQSLVINWWTRMKVWSFQGQRKRKPSTSKVQAQAYFASLPPNYCNTPSLVLIDNKSSNKKKSCDSTSSEKGISV